MTTEAPEKPVDAVSQNGGEPPAAPDGSSDPPLAELELRGSQLTIPSLGGKPATKSSFKLNGGKVKLESGTSFKKGEILEIRLAVVVNKVGQKDTHDPQTGIVVECEQLHEGRITDIQIIG